MQTKNTWLSFKSCIKWFDIIEVQCKVQTYFKHANDTSDILFLCNNFDFPEDIFANNF